MDNEMSDSESLRRLRRLLSLLEGEPPPGDSVQLWEQLTQHVTNLREELREMQDRCATLFNIASAGRAILVEGRIVDCNHELAAMLRYPREQLLGMSPLEFSPELQPDGRRSAAAAAQHLAEAAAGRAQRFYWRHLRNDRETVDAEVFLCQCRHAQRPAVLAVIHDITAYTSAEHALFQSQHMFQWVLNTIPQRVFWKDRDYRYLGCNRAFLEDAGLSDPSQLIGKTDLDLHWRDIAELYHADDRWVVENINAKLGYEEPLVRPDGSLRWLRVSKVPLFDAEGQVVGVLGVYEDITEAKGAEERQRKLEAQVQYAAKLESLGVLAGGIAHDFNNLLTGILGHADLALAELSPVSPARENLEQIEASARRAAELTRQMLAYSGRGRYFVQTTRIGEVINEMVRLLEISVSPKCVLKYRFRPDVPSIEVDVAQLRQVVMNLVVNASEAIGDKSGVITLSTGVMHCDAKYLSESYLDEGLPEGDYVYLEVADTGCGMDGETRARVFDPFFSTKFTGRGLGLAAVLGIVRAHRGAIKVYSEPGRGSTFKVLFPAAPVRAEGAVPRHATDAWQGHGAILVVDDEPMVRALAQRMLSRCGFEVTLASDGREALEIFRRDPAAFRLVLLDMTMPNMDGEETFRELRHIRPDVTVVLSSGYNEHEATHRFAGKGLAGFIQKPYRMDELARAVRQALGEI